MGLAHNKNEPPPSGGALLVEFVPNCRCISYSGEAFPYIQGYLRPHGISVHWIYLARNEDYSGDMSVVDPPPAHVDAIVREARRVESTVIVINQECSASFVETLGRELPRTELAIYGSDEFQSDHDLEYFDNLFGISVGKCTGRGRERTEVEPDFSSWNLLSEPVDIFPLVNTITRGSPCHHYAALQKNPFYKDLDLGEVRQKVGCAFCLGVIPDDRRERGSSEADRVAGIERELRRYAETAPAERQQTTTFSVRDPLAYPGILRSLLELSLPPSIFYFVKRADEILESEGELRECLPGLAERGHRIAFDCVGVENFSPRENGRLNKGVSTDTIERSFAMLYELETRWPETLWFFRGDGEINGRDIEALGFMMIMFTPWTELDDLIINLDTIERLSEKIEPMRRTRHQLVSRLQLFPGSAITKLAERDGLVEEVFPEPVKLADVVPAAQLPEELPWRFTKSDVATVYRFATRLLGAPLVANARPLATERLLQRGLSDMRARAYQEKVAFVPLLRTLVGVVKEAPAGADDETLLRALIKKLRETRFWRRVQTSR
jgi:hypothetical protein